MQIMRTFALIVEELANSREIDAIAKAVYITASMCPTPSIKMLSAKLGLDAQAVSRRCKTLEGLGWMKLSKDGRCLRPHPSVPQEVEARLAAIAKNIIQMSQYKSEATTRAFVDWIVAPNVTLVFGARPAFLYNKATKQQLEYDIYAEALRWALEHHGEQHFEPTPLYPDEKEFIERVKRDRLKLELSKQNNIRLSVVTKKDLTLERMLAAIPEDIPKRVLDPEGPFVRMLEKLGQELLGKHDWDRE
ncbi:MAG TPA: MarR family transcriptional regulator [Firmicutes bacterium]|nr:MarR family transcriptional regulator [Candidatus Fermentithermobacillaceae bacterium]